MDLFQDVDIIGHAGGRLTWKIECDALSRDEWITLAKMLLIYERRPFRQAVGIPTGASILGNILDKFATGNPKDPVLVVDDVYTTGTSFKEFKAEKYPDEHIIQWVIFARKPTTNDVNALFTMPTEVQ
jgi:orotate phosphoribosyltransferase-like protein